MKCKLMEFQGNHYLADLNRHELFPVDELFREVFGLVESHTEEQVISALSDMYPPQEIHNCLHDIHSLSEQSPPRPPNPMQFKIFAPTSYSNRARLKSHAFGASTAFKELLKALSRFAQIHVTQEFEGVDNMVLIDFEPHKKSSASVIIKENYDGVLLWYVDQFEMMSIMSYLHVPVVLPVHVTRGDNERIVNGMMRWYAAMRNFDAFMAFNQHTVDFYSDILKDTSMFHIVPNGVDTEFFQPIDKRTAKCEVANLLNMPEISEKQIVGYVSRFQVEKGAGIFVNIARLMPDVVFLAAGSIGDFRDYDLPSNLVCIGVQQREALPALYNAFDVFCFPSIACSETFGLVVAEAMACGTVPVITDYDGPKYVVRDTGIVVKSHTFTREIGGLGANVSAHDFAESISELLQDNSRRKEMGEKARQYALELSWENSAKCLLQLFHKLNLKKHLVRQKTYLPIGFSLNHSFGEDTRPKAVIINATHGHHNPLTRGIYDISVEEGIALALLRNHSPHEIRAVLSYLLKDPSLTAEYLNRVQGFLNSLF